MPKSKHTGEPTLRLIVEGKPVDLARTTIACEQDGFYPRESAESFWPVIAAVATEAIAAKCGVGIRNDADDVIDRAAAWRELSGDAAAARTIMSPDAATECEGDRIGERNSFGLSDEGRDTEHGGK